jgi:serine/threonine-protein kinase
MKTDRWNEIERLYEASISLPPDERNRLLAESCHDEEMRREIESLLQRRGNLPSFLEQRGLDVAAELVPRNQLGTLIGHTIDRYEVRAFIGAGGMGEVYRARDSKLDREVALKVLPPEFSEDRERVRRSEREAKLLASLNHPNIAAIYDLEESGGIRCLILEFVDGQTLADRLKDEILPESLPNGRAVIFTTVLSPTRNAGTQIELKRLDTGERRVLIPGGADARYDRTGHLLYMKLGTLMAIPFDLKKLEVTGASVPLIENVMQALNAPNTANDTYQGQFTVSNAGTLVYIPGGMFPNQRSSLMWVDRKGGTTPLPLAPAKSSAVTLRLSPEGGRFVANMRDGRDSDIWVYDIIRGTSTRLTFDGNNDWPVWSPNGAWVAYGSRQSGFSNIYMTKADASGQVERLTSSPYPQSPSSWTARGNLLAFLEFRQGKTQIWTLPVEGDRKPELFLESGFEITYPEFSPDGRWIAYGSNESGRPELYVQPYPGPGPKILVSTDGANRAEPAWTANGLELIYRNWPKFFSVEITSLSPFRAGRPRLLFESRTAWGAIPIRGWDISSDGQRFLLLHFPEAGSNKPVTQIQVVQNWSEELKRRVAVQ